MAPLGKTNTERISKCLEKKDQTPIQSSEEPVKETKRIIKGRRESR